MNANEQSPAEPELDLLPSVVLLVEDEILIRMDVSHELREAGFTVYEAGTADAAIELLQSPMQVDVVVTDVRMPGRTSGVELAVYVRQTRPSIKVIVMSGDYRPGPEDKHLFDGFFSKPFDSRLLAKTIEAFGIGTGSGSGRSRTYG